MTNVNKTLYIPLYGKAYVSRKGLFLNDPKAEEIWEKEQFPLKGKSKSKWLAYYMGIRSAVFDEWVTMVSEKRPDAVIIHIGCGMDSRVERVTNCNYQKWYDVDFPEVISERKRYYAETERYTMLIGDARKPDWLEKIPERKSAIIVMEGVSMYLTADEIRSLFEGLTARFEEISLLMDCYTVKSAELSKRKNPINDVGVTKVHGVDDPEIFASEKISFVREHNMTPQKYIDELKGTEKWIFSKVFAGGFSKTMYRLFEYKTGAVLQHSKTNSE